MKKLIALAAVVAAVSFASCGNKNASDAQADSIRIADSLRAVYQADSIKAAAAADSLKAAAANVAAADSLKEAAGKTMEKVEKAVSNVKDAAKK